MTDSSYIPLIYRRQGGNEMVVKNGGLITVEAGGAIQNGAGAAALFSSNVNTIVKLTQAAYDALSPPDASTLYAIVG
jgi:hypothetical protein